MILKFTGRVEKILTGSISGEKTVALQKVVAPGRDFVVTPGAGFHGVHFIMRRFRSRVVTDLDKSYVQMRVETKKKQTNKVFIAN